MSRDRVLASAAVAGAAFAITTAGTEAAGRALPGEMVPIPEVAIITWAWTCVGVAVWSTPAPDARTRWLDWDKRCAATALGCAAIGTVTTGGIAPLWSAMGAVAALAGMGALAWMAARHARGAPSPARDAAPPGPERPKALGASREMRLRREYARWTRTLESGAGERARWWAHETDPVAAGRSATRWDHHGRAATRRRVRAIDHHVRESLSKGYATYAQTSPAEARYIVERAGGTTARARDAVRRRWRGNERARARAECGIGWGLWLGVAAAAAATPVLGAPGAIAGAGLAVSALASTGPGVWAWARRRMQ